MYLTKLAKTLLARQGIQHSQFAETHASYHVRRYAYCPSVAYVKGLEEYHNDKYRMVCNENTIHSNADNA